jgi:hypothetical protein
MDEAADQISMDIGDRMVVRRDLNPAFRAMARLVAVAGADSDLVTALGAATAEDGGTSLGLHAGEKAVSLGAVATVGLEGTLRHDKKLLQQDRFLLKLLGCGNNL